MKTKVFSMFDTKAGFYATPFFMPNKAMAMRAFSDLSKDSQSMVYKHPEDYSLFLLGEFDDLTGEIKSSQPENMGNPIVQTERVLDQDGDQLFKLEKTVSSNKEKVK